MINVVKCVLFEYRTLFMKMALDALTIASAKSNLCLLTNVKSLLGFNAIITLLEVVHSLIKFSQLRDVFVGDFIATMKICERDVYQMHCDNQSYFEGDVFRNFHALINFAHENMNLHMDHIFKFGTNHLAFEFVKQHVWATYVD